MSYLQECQTRMPEQDRGTVDSEFFKIALDVFILHRYRMQKEGPFFSESPTKDRLYM